MYCDNCDAITYLKPTDAKLQACLLELMYLQCIYSFSLKAVHLITTENRVAYFISRCQEDSRIQEYFESVGLPRKKRVEVPDYFYKQWNSWYFFRIFMLQRRLMSSPEYTSLLDVPSNTCMLQIRQEISVVIFVRIYYFAYIVIVAHYQLILTL